MNTTIKFFALVLTIVSLFVVAPAANANLFSEVSVRITDRAAVERELGSCEAGRRIVVLAGAAHYSGHGESEYTYRMPRPTMPGVNLECDGRLERMPSAGVSVELR